MDDQIFDAVVRRLAHGQQRRALLTMVAGTVLATIAPLGAAAKSGHKHGHDDGGGGSGHGGGGHGGGGGKGDNDKIDKKQCKKEYEGARSFWVDYCFAAHDTNHDGIEQSNENVLRNCLIAYLDCSEFLKECTKQGQEQHLRCVDAYQYLY